MNNTNNNIKMGIMALASTDPSNPILAAILALARQIPEQHQHQQQQDVNNNNNNNVMASTISMSIVDKIESNKKMIKQRYVGTARQVRNRVVDIINLLKRMSSENMEVFGFSEFEKIANVLEVVQQEKLHDDSANNNNNKKRKRETTTVTTTTQVVGPAEDASEVQMSETVGESVDGTLAPKSKRLGDKLGLGLVRMPAMFDTDINDEGSNEEEEDDDSESGEGAAAAFSESTTIQRVATIFDESSNGGVVNDNRLKYGGKRLVSVFNSSEIRHSTTPVSSPPPPPFFPSLNEE